MVPSTSITVRKSIGVLGGMGPAASADLYKELIRIAQAAEGASQDGDFPEMVLLSLPMFDWCTTGFIDMESVKHQLIAGVRRLEAAGADFLIVGCNTVHHFFDVMQQSVGVPMLNMVEETVARVQAKGMTTVGVVATESNNRLQIYQKALKRRGIQPLSVTLPQQSMVTSVIGHAEGGTLGRRDAEDLKAIIADFAARGAQGAILGCTELPLAIKPEQSSLPLFNTTRIIAEEAIKAAYGRRALPMPPSASVTIPAALKAAEVRMTVDLAK